MMQGTTASPDKSETWSEKGMNTTCENTYKVRNLYIYS